MNGLQVHHAERIYLSQGFVLAPIMRRHVLNPYVASILVRHRRQRDVEERALAPGFAHDLLSVLRMLPQLVAVLRPVT